MSRQGWRTLVRERVRLYGGSLLPSAVEHIISDVLDTMSAEEIRELASTGIAECVYAVNREIARERERSAWAAANNAPAHVPDPEIGRRRKEAIAAARAAGFASAKEWRAHQRREEQTARAEAAHAKFQEVSDTLSKAVNALAFTDSLMNTQFALGDGTRVSWGEATVEQHRLRIALMQTKIDGMQRDVWMHEQALAALVESGATCLRELSARQAALAQLEGATA